MLGFMQNRFTDKLAQIADKQVTVKSGETILQAALREGIDFPNSCRVGGCGACKCRVVSGEVRELTETGYLLTAQELEQNTILACQSVPLTDVEVAVELPDTVAGTVVGQTRLTHDITRVDIELERPVDYRAGQYAHLQIDALPDHARSYSFATPPQADGRVSFFIRHVPDGRFSSLVHSTDILGHAVQLQGPSGGFYLRPGQAPLLFVAGGSGLAPILAILEAAFAEGVCRPVTVLFGARAQRDLYMMKRLEQLADGWPSDFRLQAVLCEEPVDSDWTGERGLVTEHIRDAASARTHAYLCGPPGMVDAALAALAEAGVSSEYIHFDRFTTVADDPLAHVETGPVAGVWDYLKFGMFHLLGLYATVALLAGGWFTTIGLLVLVVGFISGDRFGGDDTSTPHYTYPQLLTVLAWLALPLIVLVMGTSVWTVSEGDPLGYGAGITALTGYDVLAARAATGLGHHLSGLVLTTLGVGLIALIPGHELVHRTWDRTSVWIGRMLYAFALDAPFSIEHVYGHHRYVSTAHDPATAPRGRSVYAHVVLSTIGGNQSAWQIERERLQRRKLPVWSHHNQWLRGHGISLGLAVLAALLGGPVAGLWFVACALGGKSILEMVNYMEHYGMVRDPAEPVQPHHSWNTNRRVSTWSMFNLTRHSHHHAQGEVPYGELRPYPDAPLMVDGYLSTMFLTMVPPVWHKLMTPKVLEWDQVYASPREKQMAYVANQRSGLAAFERVSAERYGVESRVG